jgi:hypothetical protein
MATRTAVFVRNAQLDALVQLCEDGAVCGYGGKRPKSIDDEPKGPKLFRCQVVGAVTVEGGTLMLTKLAPEPSAPQDGVIAWYRMLAHDGRTLWDGDVSEIGEGGSLELDHLDIQSGAEVTLDSVVYRLPETDQ